METGDNRIPTREEMYKALEDRMGSELQQKFLKASVAICGLGGLGSNIAISLARAGVGHLHLIDFDAVDITNLNRQQYNADQIGMEKTKALSENLKKIAPYCEVKANHIKLTRENIPDNLSDVDIICEAFDQAEQKAMLVNTVIEVFPEKYILSGSGMAGMQSANSIKTRRAIGKLYICGDEVTDVDDGIGLVAPRVMTCASHMAHMALRIIAGECEP